MLVQDISDALREFPLEVAKLSQFSSLVDSRLDQFRHRIEFAVSRIGICKGSDKESG